MPIIDGWTIEAGVDLENADLSGLDFSGESLNGANLKNANLTNTDLSGVDLRDANLSGANLTGANIMNADAFNATFTRAQLVDANLRSLEAEYAHFNNANLRRADLSYGNFEHAHFIGTDLTGADLTHTWVRYGNFHGASLHHTTMDETDFDETDIEEEQIAVIFRRGGNPLGAHARTFQNRSIWDRSAARKVRESDLEGLRKDEPDDDYFDDSARTAETPDDLENIRGHISAKYGHLRVDVPHVDGLTIEFPDGTPPEQYYKVLHDIEDVYRGEGFPDADIVAVVDDDEFRAGDEGDTTPAPDEYFDDYSASLDAENAETEPLFTESEIHAVQESLRPKDQDRSMPSALEYRGQILARAPGYSARRGRGRLR